MELMQALTTRRSIRKFEDRPVDRALVRQMLAAAMMAPSAGNAQPWQFVVVDDRKVLDAASEIHPYVKMAARAPLGILVCGDLGLEKYPGYWAQDCSAAMENLLLAAHGLGLGAVWTGVHPMADREAGFRELLGLPETVIPLGFAVLGWPAQAPASESRFREDRVHFNTY
ncbi:nitroreductase family protein [Pseudodesulfovibrio sp.]|uniref:nitroreductase family protein n=1 Tax=Pseudodesulfovibrio sp. TaxID=2035812 RepID=UPI00262C527A|nr:nitroreductase family protein [Pseudodesulfovibrio sp.]MDD3312070.1 nitroreductase family protein [Pseudodesulfovibrio sp.]